MKINRPNEGININYFNVMKEFIVFPLIGG